MSLFYASDLISAMEAIDAILPPLAGAAAALIACPLVVLDSPQYARATALGLSGRVSDMRFEACAFDGGRVTFAKNTTDEAVHRAAEVAFLIPAVNAEDCVYDVAAWVPETGKVASLAGEIGVLGLPVLDGARLSPPIVYESLLSWLLADEPGLFILDARIAAEELDGVTIAALDAEAGIRLRSRLAPHCKRAPKIVVARGNARRAG